MCLSFLFFRIVGSYAADELGSGICRVYRSFADFLDRESERHSNILKMHADKCTANIKSGFCSDMLNNHGVLHIVVCSGGKGSAGFGHRSYAYLIVHIFLRRFPFNYKSTVKVLTTLGGEIQALFLKHWQKRLNNGNTCFR